MFSIKYVNSLKNWKWEGISCIKLQKNEKYIYDVENNNHKCFVYKKWNPYDEKKKLQNTDLVYTPMTYISAKTIIQQFENS